MKVRELTVAARPRPRKRKQRKHVWLTQAQLEKALELAELEGRTLADMIRRLIDKGLAFYEIR